MARTTDTAVRKIIEIDADLDTKPFIEAASAMVTEHCSTLTATTAELVERWLSAHFICITDPRATKDVAKGVGASYQSKVDLGLNVSHYGQMALSLDSSGGLSSWNSTVVKGTRKTASLSWLGTEASEVEA